MRRGHRGPGHGRRGLTRGDLDDLHALGVRVAIDDFGTGQSSLGALGRFPVDVVKIDQSLVAGIDGEPVHSAVVSAVVALAKAIGATTVVEGVETLPQLEQLTRLGCDVAQGYYFARPLTAAAFSTMLTASAVTPPNLHVVGERARRLNRARCRARRRPT